MGQVAERVVHPAHVPFEAEAEPAQVRGTGDARPGRRLLGDRHRAGDPPVDGRVHLLQERDRLQVLPPAVDVGLPAALRAGVVEVEHRGHGVDPQAVDVELLEPEQRVRDQEVADLAPAEVEDVGAPVELLAAARVRVLVERRAVEAGQREGVLGEVRRDPVDEHADAGGVQGVDEVPELVGVAEAGGRGVVRGHLVTPRPAERVLGHRQELHVGEAVLADVVDELLGELAVGQPDSPRPEVDLVDRHRRLVPLRSTPASPTTPRRATRVAACAPPTRSPAGPRWRRRTGPPSRATGRPCPAPGTCRRCRRRCPARTAPRRRWSREPAWGSRCRSSS